MTDTMQEKKSSLVVWVSGLVSLALVVAAIAVADPADHAISPRLPLERTDGTLIKAWRGLGDKLVKDGVIDEQKFLQLYASNPFLEREAQQLLSPEFHGPLVITADNSAIVLNLLWALGLGNANPILESKQMRGLQTGALASTGGWTLSRGMPMDHYGRHGLVSLSSEQQKRVEEVSSSIFRPCCNNPTSMPDCNHGMALLGMLEVMASEDASIDEMYEVALVAQRYWFPDAYGKMDAYASQKGLSPSPKEFLSAQFSSGSGIARITAELQTVPRPSQGSGSCSV